MRTKYGITKKELYQLAWQKPVLAQVEITRNCNQLCSFCFRSCSQNHVYEDLGIGIWKRIIDDLISIGVRRFDFSGGESFLHPEFTKIVEWTKLRGMEVNVNTNGTFDIAAITRYVNNFVFSVHGLGKVHNKIVGRKDSFSKIEENIALADQKGSKVTLNMCVVKMNLHQIVETFNYFNERYNIYKFAPFLPIQSHFGGTYECALEINQKNLDEYFEALLKIPTKQRKLKHGLQGILINNPKCYGSEIQLPNCAAGKYKMVVEFNGDVYPCHFFKSPLFLCGNLLKQTASDIWQNGQGFQVFRDLILNNRIDNQCLGCQKKHKCFSGCLAWSENYRQGGFGYAKDLRCEYRHAYIGNRSDKSL